MTCSRRTATSPGPRRASYVDTPSSSAHHRSHSWIRSCTEPSSPRSTSATAARTRSATWLRIRRIGAPLADVITRQPYTDLQSLFDDDLPKGTHYYIKGEYLPDLSGDFLEAFRDSQRARAVDSVGGGDRAHRRCSERTRRRRRGGRQPRRQVRRLVRRRVASARSSATNTLPGRVRRGRVSVASRREVTTSISRPMMKTNNVCVRPMAATSIGCWRSRRSMTRPTCFG